MEAKPSSSAKFPPTDFRFWTDKSSWKTKPLSLAAKSPPLRSTNYTILPGLDATKFKEYLGNIRGKEQFFLAMSLGSAGLHYCFKTMQSIPLNIWIIILRNEGSDDDMDRNYKMGLGWNNVFDLPRVIAKLQHGDVVAWDNDWNNFEFDDPETIAKLRSKLGLPPLHPPKYTLPPAFTPKDFKKYIGTFQKKYQSFLAMNICSDNPMEPPIWLVILRNEGSSFLDPECDYVFGWKDDVDTPRVIAILQHGSVVTWNDHQFDSPETIANLRSKLGLPPLPKSD